MPGWSTDIETSDDANYTDAGLGVGVFFAHDDGGREPFSMRASPVFRPIDGSYPNAWRAASIDA